ncbi:MAG: deoxynucleoside kinase [Bacillota bacterium]|nr:deoxynucleoside kinase [Bacillota bacterium]
MFGNVVVDGMTGVGKTSLSGLLARKFNLQTFEEIFRDENDLLGKYFKEGKKWCFPMQVSFLNNRYQQYKEACKIPNAIMDRSIYSDPIFAELYYKKGDMKPEEYFVYKSLFRSLVDSLKPPKLVIYLDVSLDEVIRRIKMRGRNDELNMPDSYWRDLLETYTLYYDNYKLSPLLKINVNDLDFVNNPRNTSKIVEVFKDWFNSVTASEHSA